LAVGCGYDARQPVDHPTPFEPTELIPFRDERLWVKHLKITPPPGQPAAFVVLSCDIRHSPIK
jgi:hypothetical protein